MKKLFIIFVLLAVSAPLFGQSAEETQRKLRRIETRTTSTDLYKDRDSLVSLLKIRMIRLNEGVVTTSEPYFSGDAQIIGPDGKGMSVSDYQKQKGKVAFREYKLKNLRIEEKNAMATETYTEPSKSANAPADRKVTVISELRKTADGRWQVTRMRISSI